MIGGIREKMVRMSQKEATATITLLKATMTTTEIVGEAEVEKEVTKVENIMKKEDLLLIPYIDMNLTTGGIPLNGMVEAIPIVKAIQNQEAVAAMIPEMSTGA